MTSALLSFNAIATARFSRDPDDEDPIVPPT
jgi:hypothetical protein